MKQPNPFFHLLEEFSFLILILITPFVIGVLLYEQGIEGFRLVCIAIIGTICLWAVYFTIKMLQISPKSSTKNTTQKEF